MSTKSKSAVCNELRTLRAGIVGHLSDVPSVTLGTTAYANADLTGQIDAFLAVEDQATDAENQLRIALAAMAEARTKAGRFRAQMQSYVAARYGKDNPILSDFGFSPAQPRAMTAAAKALSVVQGKATRKARGTLGKKEREAIKGPIDPDVEAALRGEGMPPSSPIVARHEGDAALGRIASETAHGVEALTSAATRRG